MQALKFDVNAPGPQPAVLSPSKPFPTDRGHPSPATQSRSLCFLSRVGISALVPSPPSWRRRPLQDHPSTPNRTPKFWHQILSLLDPDPMAEFWHSSLSMSPSLDKNLSPLPQYTQLSRPTSDLLEPYGLCLSVRTGSLYWP